MNDVVQLRKVADVAQVFGLPVEVIAHMAFAGRNALKLLHRRPASRDDLDRIELRNTANYGNSVSTSIETLFKRYGSWAKVIDAACRSGGKDLGL